MSTAGGGGEIEGRRLALAFLCLGLPLVLVQAFVPLESFIQRGDDAYYYFKIAANFPEAGFWTFDGIHPTNGVQPLWAVILTGVALLAGWLGLSDPDILARIFVGVTAVVHFAACLLLFDLLARKISTLTGLVAAGAFLFPLGIVWARVWGMESGLYALLFTATLHYFHLRFLTNQTPRGAAILGILLGLTILARLNAGCLLAAILLLNYFCRPRFGPTAQRFRMTLVAGALAASLTLPYFAWNLYDTGHLLPVSGNAKSVQTANLLEDNGVESVFSSEFVELLDHQTRQPVRRFVTSRMGDAFWITGGRVIFVDGEIDWRQILLPAVLFCLAAPLLFGAGRDWVGFLGSRFRKLREFDYLIAVAVLDVGSSALMFPRQVRYALIRWWWIHSEILIVAVTATVVAAFLGYTAHRFLPTRWLHRVAASVLGILVVLHSVQTANYYWSETFIQYDWSKSYNTASYEAAQWLSENVPADARVGCWNAGLVGYYAKPHIVNLDGLVNNQELLPYIAEDRIADYVRWKNLGYLADLESMFAPGVREQLPLTEVYRRDLGFDHYVIFRVESAEP